MIFKSNIINGTSILRRHSTGILPIVYIETNSVHFNWVQLKSNYYDVYFRTSSSSGEIRTLLFIKGSDCQCKCSFIVYFPSIVFFRSFVNLFSFLLRLGTCL